MSALHTKLKRVIADHLELASPREILSIASTLSANDAEPSVNGASVAKPARYQVNGDVVVDTLTGLEWSRASLPAGRMNWEAAKKACAALSLGGHSDWRLPTVRELLSIVDYERSGPAIDPVFACESAYYWSSTIYKPSPGDCAWSVSFDVGGSSAYGQSGGVFVRAVRAGQLIGPLVW